MVVLFYDECSAAGSSTTSPSTYPKRHPGEHGHHGRPFASPPINERKRRSSNPNDPDLKRLPVIEVIPLTV